MWGATSILIMCDREGNLGDPDAALRRESVERHFKWVTAAKHLGCHSIRVNGYSEGSYDEQMKLVADGLHQLCEFGEEHGLHIIIENHGASPAMESGLPAQLKWQIIREPGHFLTSGISVLMQKRPMIRTGG